MPFPETNSQIYNKNTLSEVICQFRFPPILAIESDVPTEFQEAIRKDYPLLEEKVEVQVKLQDEHGIPSLEVLNVQPSIIKRQNYEFITTDENWKINLTSSFLSLSTREYSRWQSFKEHLEKAFHAFVDIYQPPYFVRIGLRYINIIRRSELGLDNVPWSELLQPHILGMLTTSEISDSIVKINHVTELRLDDQSLVRIANGFLHELGKEETAYIIDSDFFTTEKTDIAQALNRLDYLNDQAIRVFHWSVSKRLQDAMEGQPQ